MRVFSLLSLARLAATTSPADRAACTADQTGDSCAVETAAFFQKKASETAAVPTDIGEDKEVPDELLIQAARTQTAGSISISHTKLMMENGLKYSDASNLRAWNAKANCHDNAMQAFGALIGSNDSSDFHTTFTQDQKNQYQWHFLGHVMHFCDGHDGIFSDTEWQEEIMQAFATERPGADKMTILFDLMNTNGTGIISKTKCMELIKTKTCQDCLARLGAGNSSAEAACDYIFVGEEEINFEQFNAKFDVDTISNSEALSGYLPNAGDEEAAAPDEDGEFAEGATRRARLTQRSTYRDLDATARDKCAG
jgi:hypothetical protein